MIRAFNRIPLAVKLPASILMLALAATLATAIVAKWQGRSALLEAAETRLIAVAQSRVEALRATQNAYRTEIQVRASDPSFVSALVELEDGFNKLRADGDPGEILTKEYVNDNPNPPSERHKLIQGASYSPYNLAHRRYHPSFANLVNSGTYYELFLIAPNGDVIYSVTKEPDFASNLRTGQWKDTGLAQVARQVLEAAEPGQIAFSDIDFHAPSAGVSASFAAAPVFDEGGKLVGAIAVQLATGAVDERMQRRSGLGETGLAMLVGPDGLLRSNRTKDGEPDVLRTQVPPEILGETDPAGVKVHTGPGMDGQPSIIVTAPYAHGDIPYTVLVEQSLEEVLVPVRKMVLLMAEGSAVALLVVIVVGFFVGRSVARPIRTAAGAVAEIGKGNYAAEVTGTARGDELGVMARSLAGVRDTLAAGEGAARESAFKSAALEGASASLMMLDRDCTIKFVNPAAKALLTALAPEIRKINSAFTPDALLGMSLEAFRAVPDDVRRTIAAPGGLPMRTEIKLGDAQIELSAAEVTRDGEGTLGLVLEWKDITLDRQNGAILKALGRSQAMMLFDDQGRVVSANENLRASTGTSEEAFVGRACADFVTPVDGAPSLAEIWDRLRRGDSVLGRFRVAPPGGRDVLLEGGFGPIPDHAGKLMRVSFLANDVTEADASLHRAAEAREELEAAQKRVVDQLRIALSRLADGDLTTRIEEAFGADYETLRADFNAAVDRLAQAITAVIDNAQSITGEVKEISNAADDLSRRTERQAATLEETAAALDQLTSSVRSAAEGAAEANRVVEDAKQSAEASGTVVQQTVSAMAEISSSSEKISKIIGVIDDIAFQTNLLALNAGVEAARAGEAGRGFAVVASEVRALAQRSSDAAREINDLISASSTQVRRGVGLVGQAGDALKGIVTSVTNIAARVSEIAASAREQSVGLGEINTAVNELDQVTQQNAAMFEQTSAASHSLTREADALASTTARFRVPGGAAPAPAQQGRRPSANAPAAARAPARRAA
ncbi:MAG: methyl-accepting chemotaxis protein, partial [Paracoccaceae bacterium]